jgi:hypothetical protein
MARKARQLTGVMVRLPEKLRQYLERRAYVNGRSMNSEIIFRLEGSAEVDPPVVILRAVQGELRVLARTVTRFDERLERLEQRIDKLAHGGESKS